jgi:hypothetical protein
MDDGESTGLPAFPVPRTPSQYANEFNETRPRTASTSCPFLGDIGALCNLHQSAQTELLIRKYGQPITQNDTNID